MKTPLALRSLETRLVVAYMAHARWNFVDCEPGNSFTRLGEYVSGSQNQWHNMWIMIGRFYDAMSFGDLSDGEIKDRYTAAMRVGFDTPTKKIEASTLIQAVSDWRNRNWSRYLQKSASRHAMTGKIAMAGLVIFGIPSVDV